MESAADSAPWEIWIDTGGTFTDCLARDPHGSMRRAKVLSTSAVRGSVRERLDGRTLRIRAQWAGPGALVEGFEFRTFDDPPSISAVLDFDTDAGLLRLSAPVGPLAPDSAFELRSDEEAPILAARLITGTGSRGRLPPLRMRLATTRATNALLERAGAAVALFVTSGFADLLRIGTQQRADLFSLGVGEPPPLHSAVFELNERLSSSGDVLRQLDEHEVRRRADSAVAAGIRVAAVCLMHSVRNAAHERAVESILFDAGFTHVSRSSALATSANLLERSGTAVVNAYLAPLLDLYFDAVSASLRSSSGGSLHLMTSGGGLVRREQFAPKDSLLSGPAGGVVGAAAAGRRAGFDRIISFDMGGTSTDVARFDGDFEYVWSHHVGDAKLLAAALAIETIAAGGGSICSFRAGGLSVGPESAGADPGPACYGGGGPLTITDCNLLLGRIDPDRFEFPISIAAAERALDDLRIAVADATGAHASREFLLEGLIEIAEERMADAARAVSLRRGFDPADYALVAFGGAGPQHACGVARRLGIRTVVVPPDAGLLSAWGLGAARIERIAERQLMRRLDPGAGIGQPPWLVAELRSLAETAIADLAAEGVPEERIEVRRRIANLRFVGQDSTLAIELDARVHAAAAFEREYEEVYGHRPAERPIEVESLRVIASDRAPVPPSPLVGGEGPHPTLRQHRLWLGGAWREVPLAVRGELATSDRISGPALIADDHTSILVEEGWAGHLDATGALVLTIGSSPGLPSARPVGGRERPAPVVEQLFTARFEGIVGEMGEQLRRTALSTNVKERLDFSCAILDRTGQLVANAPHIPVHLGAIGLCVRSVVAEIAPGPGDVIITNHPGFGGSHLPDITAITPVHTDDGELIGYVANRAHHAEIGGSRPGSMPPHAHCLADEGVVIVPARLIEANAPRWDWIERLLSAPPHPSRAVADNLADLRAQVAANQRGARLLRELEARHGAAMVLRQMDALTARSERLIRTALSRLADGEYAAAESLDDGATLRVRFTISGDQAIVDFAGTSATHPGNLNATPAIVRSAVIYLLRLIIDEPLPLNEGLLRPVRILTERSLLDPDFMLPPESAPAVVGGNTEVSQRLVDTLIKALGLAACSQGTMNNVLWGTPEFGYYETLGGGEGAAPERAGRSGIHTHMTNTRITDAEILELRYPVRVERFALRGGSGGAGTHRGGDGLIREITFLDEMSLSVLTQHRVVAPYGAAGGSPAMTGRQRVVRRSGEVVELASVDGCEVARGDRLVIETPGGGGWGPPG